MDAERWQRLSPLLDALFELDPPARALRLRELRDEDPALAEELQTLIALEEGHEDFLAEPLVAALSGARPGSNVGPYRLESLLGEGGMGQVWLASRADGLYQRRVALKLLRPGLADTNLRIRFTRERQILARLAHPHIARLLDAGISTDGLPYLALEYVEGEPITDYCRNHATALDKRLRMFQQICDAVSHAHANLIVHRDLKPSNILVTPGGDVRLLDFGIAKLLDTDVPIPEQTRTGVRAFTLHYAAPEQVRGEPVTTMTDVYSLGVVLYELLTETKPYRLKRQTDAEWEEAILAADPLRPSQAVLRNAETTGGEGGDADAAALRRHARQLTGDLDNIVLKTLSKRPEQRYPSVEALALDLQRFEAGRPVQARAQSLSYRFNKYVQRHRWALATATLVTLVLGAALAIVAWQARQAVQEASRAQAMQDFMVGLFENARGTPEGEALDLRGLLDASVARGNRELARQPRARAELLGVVARLRTGLGDYQEARVLLERQAAIIELTDDIPSSLRLESLTQRGQVLRLLGESRACIELMQPWLDRARREQAQLPTQAAEFYSQLGRCRRANGERQSARQLFERSLLLRREILDDDVGEVENLMDMAGLQADVGESRAALAGFERARAQLRQSGGEKHPLLVEIGWNIAARQRDLGQTDASEREARDALAIAQEVNGAQHPATLAARRQLAAIHVDQGRFALAEGEFAEIRDLLSSRLGADHADLSATYNSLGVIAWERGDLDAAVVSLRRAIEIARKQGDTGRLSGTLFNLAMVLHEQTRDREALALLQESRHLRDARYGVDHPLLGDTDRMEGEVRIALGERERGMTLLADAVRQTRAGYGTTHPHTRRAELSQAYQQAQLGDTDALNRLDTLSSLPNADIELRKIGWLAQAYAARIRCARTGADAVAARERLDVLHRTLHAQRPDGSAIGREIDGIRRGCG
ncbi:serine/threonine-protein kinase [Lysobacter silvisoli]|uniref:Serine/threonine protein kinase n=1 Tax=Lysobacter silvisoli TaxID=2293254 RepID=A0A371JXQ9_9GAMM|nr:serine/threonine-protein kinase [Lysobacter silvisoli]RDZ26441.1 serine/threonine protein kinase [Lysobacter silvisoli]